MSWFDGMLGNASKVSDAEAQKEFAGILSPGETVIASYKLVRDFVVFTDLRLIMVDKQGLTGKKIEYHSMPYKSISHFAVETAGTFDLDAELKIWVGASVTPIERKFNRQVNIYEVQSILAKAVCG